MLGARAPVGGHLPTDGIRVPFLAQDAQILVAELVRRHAAAQAGDAGMAREGGRGIGIGLGTGGNHAHHGRPQVVEVDRPRAVLHAQLEKGLVHVRRDRGREAQFLPVEGPEHIVLVDPDRTGRGRCGVQHVLHAEVGFLRLRHVLGLGQAAELDLAVAVAGEVHRQADHRALAGHALGHGHLQAGAPIRLLHPGGAVQLGPLPARFGRLEIQVKHELSGLRGCWLHGDDLRLRQGDDAGQEQQGEIQANRADLHRGILQA